MRRLLIIMGLTMALASCATSHKQASNQPVHPDEVFTITEDDIDRETREVNRSLQGEWKYKGPSVDVSGKSLIAGLGKPIAKSKIKKKLKEAYKKIGLTNAGPKFTFAEDGTCNINMMGANIKGKYNYNPDRESITMKWHGIPITAHLKRDGKKKIHMTFEADKLLTLIKMLGSFSDNSAIKSLSFLLDNYEDVMVGFELKK